MNNDKNTALSLKKRKPQKVKKDKAITTFKPLVQGDFYTVSEDRSTVVVELYQPIKSGKETISELILRRPQFGDLAEAFDMKNGDDAFQISLNKFALLAGVSARTISQLDEIEDIPVLLEAAGAFRSLPDYKDAQENPFISISDDKNSCEIRLVHTITDIDRNGDEISYDRLVMHRPTISATQEAAKKEPKNIYLQEMYKLSGLCNVPVSVIKQIDSEDDEVSIKQAADLFRGRRSKR